MKPTLTLKVRVKDKHAPLLRKMSRGVNFVWNYINELSHKAIVGGYNRPGGHFMSAYDLHPYTKGAGKELGLHSQTLQVVAHEYVTRRKQFKKNRLNWRKSFGAHRALGWIPVNTGAAQWENGQMFHNGHHFKVWDSYGLSQYRFRTATFAEDSRGRCYFNVVVDVEPTQTKGTESVGIDLGCKETATTSNGEVLKGRWYRELEEQLGKAQRARKKQRVKAIHAKIANRRKDDMHTFSRKLVIENAAIVVGNVSSQAMVKRKKGFAKSALDAGWAMLKTMLDYKCAHAGSVFLEVNEAYTTQTCSSCGLRPDSRPNGIAGLGIRE